jgi:hypothetical protein
VLLAVRSARLGFSLSFTSARLASRRRYLHARRAVLYASAAHQSQTLQMHVGCEIPRWGEPKVRQFICAAEPLTVTFETSSPAFLGPRRTIARAYNKPRIKTRSFPDLCTSLLLCQTVLHSLRSLSSSAKNGMLRNTSVMPIASYSVRYLVPPTSIRCPFSRSSLTRLSLNLGPFCSPMVQWHVFENRTLPNPLSCLN